MNLPSSFIALRNAIFCVSVAVVLQAVGSTQSQPLRVDVAVIVRNPAVAVPAGFTIFHGAKGIETPNFDFRQTLEAEFIAALSSDQRVRLRAVESGPPDVLERWVKLSQAPADADRLLQVDVEIIQAIKIKLTSKTEFTLRGHIAMVNKQGKKIWSDYFTETVRVRGKMEEFLKDDQKGLKEALNQLIEHFVKRKREKFGKLKTL